MPHIRLKEHGFDDLTGEVGGIQFKDGVSVENISRRDADRLGACFKVEDADSGEQCNASDTFSRRLVEDSDVAQVNTREEYKRRMAAKETDAETTDGDSDDEKKTETPVADESKQTTPDTDESDDDAKIYTEAELVEIADEKGLEGLREIAQPLGVTARSIKQLLPLILKAQAK